MEKWIIRLVALLVAGGSLGLFWTFGAFVAVPWQEGRMLALGGTETQILAVSLLGGLLVAWGALHLLAIADRAAAPRLYIVLCLAMPIACLAAVAKGIFWTMAHLVR